LYTRKQMISVKFSLCFKLKKTELIVSIEMTFNIKKALGNI
jgi:hypothetical protein